jgi:hypothetical protein
LVCPYLPDTNVANTISSLYVCTDSNLDGKTQISSQSAVEGTGWTALSTGMKVDSSTFQTGVLLFAKISCSYYGRKDILSGQLGGAYILSSTPITTVDSTGLYI